MTFVVTTIWGGFSMCFFTAHCSAERMTASLYFSGKLGGSWISSSIFEIICVVGIALHALNKADALGWQAALAAKAEDVDARACAERSQEERERRRG